jgi:capsular exopolysaccharide synthesis family protein
MAMLQTPLLNFRGDSRTVGSLRPQIGDYCQSLLRQIEQGQDAGAPVKTLGITSCNSGAGVSTIAANLALVAARQTGSPTLLVDANLSSPVMGEQFALRKGAGIAELMNITDSPLDYVQPTSITGLSVLAAGHSQSPGNTHFSAIRFLQVLDVLKTKYPLIIVDLPVADELTCCFSIAGLLDGIILVLESEKVQAETARRTRDQLLKTRARVLGTVLNKRRSYLPKWLVRA